jgi:hypothetical protein
LLYSLSSSAGISGVIQWSGLVVLFMLSLNNGYAYQLDAIPTVGFTDPVLSYFSALQFTFDGVRMLREGYKKVIYLSFSYMHPSANQTDDLPTYRQDQVYSKLPISEDGQCWFPDLSLSTMSGKPLMMSCPRSNH